MPHPCTDQPSHALALRLKRGLAAVPLALGLAAAVSAGGARAQGPVPPAQTPTLPPGLYVQVLDGMIHATNPAGSSNISAGQFGFTPSPTMPPVLVPRNPAIQFTPPPVFNSSTVSGPASTASGKSNSVDCEVR